MSEEIAGATPPPGWPRDRRRPLLHLALFAATFLTACAAGSWYWEGTLDSDAGWALLSGDRLARGVPYASLLLLILGAHEMGHYLACRHYGVRATLPFFIPGPPLLIGTLGAVIRIRAPIPTRRALFDIAAAGPIAGFVVALPILVVGVARATEIPPGAELHGASLSAPLISVAFERLFHDSPNLQVGSIYGAAWVGMLVTSMNLFPVGQLDGGHALFAISPRAHYLVSWATIFTLGLWVVGHTVTVRMPSAYTLWLVILLFLRARHPRLADDGEPLGAGRYAVAVLLGAIFLASFIATPIVFD